MTNVYIIKLYILCKGLSLSPLSPHSISLPLSLSSSLPFSPSLPPSIASSPPLSLPRSLPCSLHLSLSLYLSLSLPPLSLSVSSLYISPSLHPLSLLMAIYSSIQVKDLRQRGVNDISKFPNGRGFEPGYSLLKVRCSNHYATTLNIVTELTS